MRVLLLAALLLAVVTANADPHVEERELIGEDIEGRRRCKDDCRDLAEEIEGRRRDKQPGGRNLRRRSKDGDGRELRRRSKDGDGRE